MSAADDHPLLGLGMSGSWPRLNWNTAALRLLRDFEMKHSTRPIGWSTRMEFHVQHTLKIEKYLRNSRNKRPKNFPSEGHFRSESGQNHPKNGHVWSLCVPGLWVVGLSPPDILPNSNWSAPDSSIYGKKITHRRHFIW